MPRHLLMRLSAPLMAFGGETIDNLGIIRDFPALSMLTGLLANALGYGREEDELLDHLQARLVFGCRLEGSWQNAPRLMDYQTAVIHSGASGDQGWTTLGEPETRRGAAGQSTLQRYRDYHTDGQALIALRLEPAHETPTLDELAQALDHPARPLFIGRKHCLPNQRVFAGWQEAENILGALQNARLLSTSQAPSANLPTDMRVQWPQGEGQLIGDRAIDLCDERNWRSGVHGGWRQIRAGSLKITGTPR